MEGLVGTFIAVKIMLMLFMIVFICLAAVHYFPQEVGLMAVMVLGASHALFGVPATF